MEFVLLFIRWWLLGAALVWSACILTREMRVVWLRNAIRAFVAGFAFTPTLTTLAGTSGLWPLPAGWVLICCIGERDPIELYSNLFWGGLPILFVGFGIWMALNVFGRSRSRNPIQ